MGLFSWFGALIYGSRLRVDNKKKFLFSRALLEHHGPTQEGCKETSSGFQKAPKEGQASKGPGIKALER
jgi:hypothetical protein